MTAHDGLASLEVAKIQTKYEQRQRPAPGVNTTMKSPICDMLGIEFPILAFSHCRDVVAAVSKVGGFGVLGAVAHTPEQLEIDLAWIEEHSGGRPYGVDLLLPQKYAGADEGGLDRDALGQLL